MMVSDVETASARPVWPRYLFVAERYLLSLAMGVFTQLPIYFLSVGRDEVFFGLISTTGVIAALAIISLSPALLRHFGLRALAPAGGLLYAAGCATIILNELSGIRAPFFYLLSYVMQSGGWALHFTVGSICISALAVDTERSFNFMIYAAFSTLGLTCGPLLASLLARFAHFDTVDMFSIAFLTSISGSILSYCAARDAKGIHRAEIPKTALPSRDIIKLLSTKTILFFILVLLSASIYTTLINFQTLFAIKSGLRHEIFFAFWAIGVVGSRFAIGSRVSRMEASRVLPLLLSGMIISIIGFVFAPGNPLIYGLASISIGVTYGLSYPLIQAEAVRVAPPQLRTVALVVFSLSYFIGLYFFPFAAALASVHLGYEALTWLMAGLACLQTALALLGYHAIGGTTVSTTAEASKPGSKG